MAYPRLPLEQQAEIIDAYVQAGMTPFEIGEMHHIAEGQVLSILREHEIPTGKKGASSVADKFSEGQINDIVTEYRGIGTVKALLGRYGLSHQQLYDLLEQIGEPTRKLAPDNIKHRHGRLQKAVELYVDHVPMWQIEDETGVTSNMLYKELHTRGIPLRVKKYGRITYRK